MTNTSYWPKEVIDIEQLKTILDANNINIAEELDLVLRQDKHINLPYGKRHQHVRFATILGAVYTPDSIYEKKEREKHLKKLRRYYDQKATKAYIKPETAEFYCNFLDQVKDSIEQRHSGIKLPLTSIDRPKEKEQSLGTGVKKTNRSSKTLADKIVKIDRYQVINPSILQKLSADELSKLLDETFKEHSADITSTADKDKLLKLISNLKYAFAYAQNDDKKLEQNSHLNHVRRLYNYQIGQNLTPKTQKLYVTYMEAVEEKLKNEHPDYQIEYDEIPLLYESDRPVPEPEPEPVPEPEPEQERPLDSYTSDEWKQILDGSKDGDINPVYLSTLATSLGLAEGIEISSLRDVLGDKFPNNFDQLSKEEKETKIQELKSSLTPVELAKFNISLTKKAEQLAESLPPHQLVVMAKDIDALLTKDYSKKEQTEELKQQLEALSKQKEVFVKAMVAKTKGVALGNIIIDDANIADVYDGAVEMFDYLQSLDIQLEGEGEFSFAELKDMARQKLDREIDTYDHYNGLTDIKTEDAGKLEQTFDETWKTVQEADLNNDEQKKEWLGEDLAKLIDSLKFEGDDAAKKKATFIDTIKLTAARNAAVKGAGKEGDELKAVLKEELQAVGTAHISTLITTDALANLPENATEQQKQEAIEKALHSPEHKISDKGVIAFQAGIVNNHISFLNRLATKLNNRKAAVLHKMYGPIAKIDETCIARFGSVYTATRSFGKMMARNMGAQALNQGLRIGCNIGSLALGVPGVGGYVYAGIYASMATRRFYKAYKDEKANAAARGEKFGLGKFLFQKAPEIALTAAGTAAAIFGGTIAQKGVESVVRYGMMSAGWLISFSKGINASRKQGNGWWKSIGKAFTNATASTATAVASGAIISAASVPLSGYLNHAAMDFFNRDESSAVSEDGNSGSLLDKFRDAAAKINDLWGEHATRQIHADEYHSDDASFTKDTVENPDDFRNMSDEQLNENGIIKDGIAREEVADLVGKSDEDLARDGIVRSITDENDSNGVRIVDTPASSAYADGVTDKAENIVKYWTSAAPEIYENNIADLTAADGELAKWNAAHPAKVIDANRLELIVGDCGGQMVGHDVDTLTNHVNGDMNNENPQQVHGNHKVFGQGWLAEHGQDVGVTAEDISKIAALHGPDGKIDVSKLDASTLEAISKLDNIVSKNNEVLDTECTRGNAHTDGFLHRNASPDSTSGAHIHTDSDGSLFNAYANGYSPKVVTPEQAHFERFDQYSHVEQHNFIPFTVTFDRMWSNTKGFVLNHIMGANGRKAPARENGIQVQPDGLTQINHKNLPDVSDNTQQTSDGAEASTPPSAKKGFFSRIFSGGKGGNGK